MNSTNVFNNDESQKMLAEAESQKIFSQEQKKNKEALARVRCEAIFEKKNKKDYSRK
jgi:hypothetical protein